MAEVRRETVETAALPATRTGCPTDDNDTIANRDEGSGTVDTDRDGIPDSRDDDSDGDTIDDIDEAGSVDRRCSEAPEDADGDGVPNFQDVDSDDNGIRDEIEGTDDTDSDLVPDFRDMDDDGDGLTDLVEQAIGTDPNDATSGIGEDEFFVILPYQDPPLVDEMDFETNIKQADVYFLIDTTGSMGGELTNIRNSLSTFIVPEVASRIRDVEFGLGHFDDIPTGGFGSPGTDEAYEHIHDISGDIASIQSAIDTFPTGSGNDWEESDVVALYCTATGEGVSTWVDPSPGCLEGRFGYPCFRPYSLPVVLLFTDAPFHNGPPDGMTMPYNLPDVPNWLDSIAVLNDIGAKVLGFASEDGSYNDLVATSVATGASVPLHSFDGTEARMTGVCDDDECCTGINGASQPTDEEGDCPLVWRLDYDGNGLGSAVVEAIEDLSTQIARDVNTMVEERPVIDDGVNAADFITGVLPLRSTPEVGIDRFDETTFYGVQPGTVLTFEVTFQNDIVPHELEPQVFVARIIVLGDNTVRLDDRRVIILIPPSDIPIS